MKNPYEDILLIPYRKSKTHPNMSNYDRAAQFAPFAALTGYGDAVKETARLTDKKIQLTEDELQLLDEKIAAVEQRINEKPTVRITYFVADEKKTGGVYRILVGTIKKINKYERLILMENEVLIPLDDIFDIDSEIFFFTNE